MASITTTSKPAALPQTYESNLRCIYCGYNLTGLSSGRCPECGWKIDWRLAGTDEERNREGTPAHRARSRRKIDQTALTVLMMLFVPWRFAKQLRADEKLGPSLAVAVASVLLAALGWSRDWRKWEWAIAVFIGIVSVIFVQSLLYATLHWDRTAWSPSWRVRFRRWLIVSFYSTCFVAAWSFTWPPILLPGAFDHGANFYLPWLAPKPKHAPDIGLWWCVTVNFYWWWAVLATVLLVRTRPRYLGVGALLFVPLLTFMASHVVAATFKPLGAVRQYLETCCTG